MTSIVRNCNLKQFCILKLRFMLCILCMFKQLKPSYCLNILLSRFFIIFLFNRRTHTKKFMGQFYILQIKVIFWCASYTIPHIGRERPSKSRAKKRPKAALLTLVWFETSESSHLTLSLFSCLFFVKKYQKLCLETKIISHKNG